MGGPGFFLPALLTYPNPGLWSGAIQMYAAQAAAAAAAAAHHKPKPSSYTIKVPIFQMPFLLLAPVRGVCRTFWD